MSKSILLFVLSFLTIFCGNAQEWIKQESNTTSDLWDVHFINSEIGFVVGSNGVLLKTIDGGENWVPKPIGTTNVLFSICFIDSLSGFAVSDNEIFKTENSGETWFLNDTVSNILLRDIQWINKDTLFIGGHKGFLKSTDGGNKWIKIEVTQYIYSFWATNSNKLFLSHSDFAIQMFYGTRSKLVNNMSSFGTFNDKYFTSPSVGYAVGGGFAQGNSYRVIRKTTNKGLNWSGFWSERGSPLRTVFFVDEKIGYVTSDTGDILKTTNSGDSWTKSTAVVKGSLRSIFFPDSDNGYAVGRDGVIIRTKKTPTKIEELDDNKPNAKLFPNPVYNKLTIECTTFNQDSKLSILDVSGSILMTNKIADFKTKIDLSNFKKGFYIVQISSDEKVETFKIIKQ